jgi:hypothetical protein
MFTNLKIFCRPENFAESEFGEFASIENCTKLLLINRIWKSQNFDKLSYCLILWKGGWDTGVGRSSSI